MCLTAPQTVSLTGTSAELSREGHFKVTGWIVWNLEDFRPSVQF